MILSIIVPVYNQENKLKKLFDCIVVVKNLAIKVEMIFINDGSLDKSEYLIKNFIESNFIFNLEFRYLSQKNIGVSATRNKGIDLARGKYVWFVDSDDEIELNNIADLIDNSIYEYDLFIFSHCQYFIKSSQLNINEVFDFYKKESLIEDLFQQKSFAPIWNKLYRKDFLIKNNINFDVNINYAEDLLFNLDVFKKSDFINVKNTLGYKYNVHEVSLSKSKVNNLTSLIEQCICAYNSLKISNNYNINFIYDRLIIDTFFKVIINNESVVDRVDKSYLDIDKVYTYILDENIHDFLKVKSIFFVFIYRIKCLKNLIRLVYMYIHIKNFMK